MGKVYAGKFRSSKINLTFDIKYPVASTQAGFKGSGTEADPYLIETLADLMALSDSVNFNNNIPEGAKYGKAFEGKYFKQTKAINAKDVYFPPIGGSDGLYRFAGTMTAAARLSPTSRLIPGPRVMPAFWLCRYCRCREKCHSHSSRRQVNRLLLHWHCGGRVHGHPR